MSFQVPTVPQDLPPSETRELIVKSLLELKSTINAVFERVEAQVDEERDLLRNLQLRIESLQQKVDQIPASSKAIKSQSLAQYPALARPAGPLLLPQTPSSGRRIGHTTLPQAADEGDQAQVKGQDTKELYAFFKELAIADGADGDTQEGTSQREPRCFTSLSSMDMGPARGTGPRLAGDGQPGNALALSQADVSQRLKNPHLAARSLVPLGSGELPGLDLPQFAAGRRPASLSPGPSTRAQSPIQPDWHAREDMGAAVSSIGGRSVGTASEPAEEGDLFSQEHREDPGGQGSPKLGLDALGSKHSDLQQSILHRQHSMSANSLSVL